MTRTKQQQIHEKIQKLERQQRRQRPEIFQVADEILEKATSSSTSSRKGRTSTGALFTIRWVVW